MSKANYPLHDPSCPRLLSSTQVLVDALTGAWARLSDPSEARLSPHSAPSPPPNSAARMFVTSLRRAGQSTLAAFQTSFQSIPKYAWIKMFRKATICGHGICG